MKTIQDIIKDFLKLTLELDKADDITSVMIINDMEILLKNKINDEIKKHLEIASNKALKKYIKNSTICYTINKESITDIEIKLT